MGPNAKKSLALIEDYIGNRVTAKLDGSLFDHEAGTFKFRFEEPEKLAEELAEGYADELGTMECLDGDEWSNDDLIPVAAVSSFTEDEDGEEADESEEFAWVFLNWKAKSPPGVLITTTDDWGDERTAKGLTSLKLKVH
jgi:hypothetical protein